MVNKKEASSLTVGFALIMIILLLILFTFLGMPYIALYISIPIVLLSILAILIIKYKPQKTTGAKTAESAETVSYEEIEGLPSDKIECPHCHKRIPKNLTFCPECGERIPPEGLFNKL